MLDLGQNSKQCVHCPSFYGTYSLGKDTTEQQDKSCKKGSVEYQQEGGGSGDGRGSGMPSWSK